MTHPSHRLGGRATTQAAGAGATLEARKRRVSDVFDLYTLGESEEADTFARDVARGLTADKKFLLPKYHYDALGSILFDAICQLPEYYLTRAESQILAAESCEILKDLPRPVRVLELGSGSSIKTRFLLEALLESPDQQELHYLPIDVSEPALESSSQEMLQIFPGLRVTAFVADYFEALEWIAAHPESLPKAERTLILFLGSTIGNLDLPQRERLLSAARAVLQPGDAFLLGADLKKDPKDLIAAYNDTLGVTSAFNLNLLARINRELGGTFDLRRFAHHARYNDTRGAVEMHLESLADQTVTIADLDLRIPFRRGETVHTENSHKFDPVLIAELATATGFSLARTFLDPEARYSESLLVAI